MSNTRDSLGEQATLDGLIAHTLTSLEEDGITNLASYAFYNNINLTNVIFPNLLTLQAYAFQGCSNLTTVDIGGQCSINGAFNGCSKMDALILRNTNNICTLTSSSALSGSKIATGFGGVYVPDTLLSTYKSASNWSAIADNIFPLSEYPRTNFDSIADSWSTIVANCNAGTIDSYNIGDTKLLDVNGTQIFMQIVAKNTDKLTDDTGTASLTWLCKNIYQNHNMNSSSSNSGGWEASAMRSWLRGTVFTYFPTELQSGIKEVKKTWYDYASKETKVSNDTIWIPSTYEMFTESSAASSVVETGEDNVQYTIFNNNTKRIKTLNGSAAYYWLRSAYASYSSLFCCVSSDGYRNSNSASYSLGAVFGFCT